MKLYPGRPLASPTSRPTGSCAQYKMDDPELIYPILDRARHRGLVAAIHKAIPLGPVPMEPFRMDDLDAAFMAYPDVPIEIVHGGFAFLEETAHQVGRFHERLRHARGHREPVGQGAGALLADRRLAARHGRGGSHPAGYRRGARAPAAAARALLGRSARAEILSMTGSPPLSKEIKRKILGENAARLPRHRPRRPAAPRRGRGPDRGRAARAVVGRQADGMSAERGTHQHAAQRDRRPVQRGGGCAGGARRDGPDPEARGRRRRRHGGWCASRTRAASWRRSSSRRSSRLARRGAGGDGDPAPRSTPASTGPRRT